MTGYYKKEDVEKLLRDMHCKVSAVQRPALDRIQSAVQRLPIIQAEDPKIMRLFGDYGDGDLCWVECDKDEDGATTFYSSPMPEV